MRGIGKSSSSTTESGSTLLEAIVALTIISILGIGAWNAVGVSIRIAGRIREKAIENVHVLQLDDALRELASRVRAPYWAPEQKVETEAGTARVSNLDGDAEKSFTLAFQDGVLTVDDGNRVLRFTEFSRVDFSAATDEKLGNYGLTMDLSTKDGRAFSMTARFSGLPIRNGATQ
jgi:hypothetical protein